MTREPTFMFCVGATKAGTSWLRDHLAGHEQCYFRTIKELHYFGMSEPAKFGRALRAGREEMARLAEISLTATEKLPVIERKLADLRDWQKLLRQRSLDIPAYRAFLTSGIGNAQLVGDVTPAYSLLPPETLHSMLSVGSDVRVVYLMRDPLARLWSHVRMLARHVAPDKFASKAEALFDSVIKGDHTPQILNMLARGDYATIVPKLTGAFGPKRLLLMFYEDLISLTGVAKLAEFLAIGPGKADFNRKVHQGLSLPMPAASRDRALSVLRPQYDYIAQHMGHLPPAWQHNMKEGIA